MTKHSLVFMLVFLYACSQEKLPAGILPLDEMSHLVEEITIIETHFQSKFGVPSQYKKALDTSVNRTLQKAGTTRAAFERSLRYYAAHPTHQQALNEDLLTSMSRKVN
jgi:hypothetical protein